MSIWGRGASLTLRVIWVFPFISASGMKGAACTWRKGSLPCRSPSTGLSSMGTATPEFDLRELAIDSSRRVAGEKSSSIEDSLREAQYAATPPKENSSDSSELHDGVDAGGMARFDGPATPGQRTVGRCAQASGEPVVACNSFGKDERFPSIEILDQYRGAFRRARELALLFRSLPYAFFFPRGGSHRRRWLCSGRA